MESKNGGLYDSGIDAPDADRALRPCRNDHKQASRLPGNLAGLRERARDASQYPANPCAKTGCRAVSGPGMAEADRRGLSPAAFGL